MLVVYGLRNCDTCKKAMSELRGAGIAANLVDIRTETDLGTKVPVWLAAAGADKLVNKRSTTWRGLADTDKAEAENGSAEAVLIANPTLIKRPVIERGEEIFVGWTKDVSSALL